MLSTVFAIRTSIQPNYGKAQLNFLCFSKYIFLTKCWGKQKCSLHRELLENQEWIADPIYSAIYSNRRPHFPFIITQKCCIWFTKSKWSIIVLKTLAKVRANSKWELAEKGGKHQNKQTKKYSILFWSSTQKSNWLLLKIVHSFFFVCLFSVSDDSFCCFLNYGKQESSLLFQIFPQCLFESSWMPLSFISSTFYRSAGFRTWRCHKLNSFMW